MSYDPPYTTNDIQSQQSHKFPRPIHISSKNRWTDLLPLLTKSRVLPNMLPFFLIYTPIRHNGVNWYAIGVAAMQEPTIIK